jgi:hypothetical protein
LCAFAERHSLPSASSRRTPVKITTVAGPPADGIGHKARLAGLKVMRSPSKFLQSAITGGFASAAILPPKFYRHTISN